MSRVGLKRKKYYLDNGDGSYTYYVYNARDNTTTAVIVYSKEEIPEGYIEGIFTVEENIG